jgi:hypothetical protein
MKPYQQAYVFAFFSLLGLVATAALKSASILPMLFGSLAGICVLIGFVGQFGPSRARQFVQEKF